MRHNKTFFIIPGYKHTPLNKAYREIAKILESIGYNPVLITIPWRKTTISENTEYFLREYKKIPAKQKYIFGFSFGAMIAFIASTKVRTSGLILCSLSPYFKEDLPKVKSKNASRITKLRYQDFSQLRYSRLAKRIKTKQIHMLYGTEESKYLIRRVNEVFDQISSRNKYLSSIKKTDHNLSSKRYLHKIHQTAKKLN